MAVIRVLEQHIIDKTVASIVKVAKPLRIILFGSAARGEAGPDSDLDWLVIIPNTDDVDEFDMIGLLSCEVPRNGWPMDFIIAKESDVNRRSKLKFDILKYAIQDGRTVYERSA